MSDAFSTAWSVAKNDYDEYGSLTDEAMASRKEAWNATNPDLDMNECQRLALEHDGDPCILCGGDGDWCWNAGLPVNEDGSLDYSMMQGYDEKGRPESNKEHFKRFDSMKKSMTYMDKGKRGLWDNVHAKRKRGEKAAKPGDKDYPDKKNWDKLTNKSYECGCNVCTTVHGILEKKEKKKDDKPFHGYNPNKHSKEGGLNAKGRAKAKKEEGANLKPPVTEKPSTLDPDSKKAKRRKSFCARMGGVKGPTSKEGKKTPKGAALDRWNC